MGFEFVVDEDSSEIFLVINFDLPMYPFVFGETVFSLARRTFRSIRLVY
jgi:hypothetical protein